MGLLIFQSNEEDDPQQPPPIQQILSFPLLLTDRIRRAADESKFYKLECADVRKHVDRLSQLLRSVVRFADSTPLYERPVRRIFNDVSRNLNRALTLLRKCRHRGIIRRFVVIVGAADFRKLCNLLDLSIGDVKWLLGIFNAGEDDYGEGGEGIILTLPPIASSDPILAWVWSCIASLHYSSSNNSKIEAASELSTLARDNDRNKMVIVEEGGVTPLLKLLKDDSSPETQISGATALFNLATDQSRARSIFNEHGVPIVVHAFRNSAILVRIEVAKLIARMAEHDHVSQEGFARENVIETLVTLLSSDVFDDDERGKMNMYFRKSIGSAVEIHKQMERSSILCSNFGNRKALSSSIWPRNKIESGKHILEFNTSCSGALWMLAKGNVDSCRKITETKGLFGLAKLIEKETGELQINCLMTVMEITSIAEYNPEIRRSAFKTNTPAAKAVADQLLRLVNQSDNPLIKIPTIRAIGHLARTFPARQTHIISPLVKQLGHGNPDVATESVIALGKFTCPENYLRAEHSKTIVDIEGIQLVMKMLRGNERAKYHALVLLCYLAMHAGKSEQFQQARLLTALEGAEKSVAYQYPELKALVAQAVHQLHMCAY
ncbi:hypothetical protein SSX86_029355 [Deinandra increscens subsp. villosa]|uniref:Armadillo repeat-containing protein n=1 Tax=Deinandra increscens subsp. villosa TaxID=3103831 RepID=A0AAP0GM94_9ASTR